MPVCHLHPFGATSTLLHWTIASVTMRMDGRPLAAFATGCDKHRDRRRLAAQVEMHLLSDTCATSLPHRIHQYIRVSVVGSVIPARSDFVRVFKAYGAPPSCVVDCTHEPHWTLQVQDLSAFVTISVAVG